MARYVFIPFAAAPGIVNMVPPQDKRVLWNQELADPKAAAKAKKPLEALTADDELWVMGHCRAGSLTLSSGVTGLAGIPAETVATRLFYSLGKAKPPSKVTLAACEAAQPENGQSFADAFRSALGRYYPGVVKEVEAATTTVWAPTTNPARVFLPTSNQAGTRTAISQLGKASTHGSGARSPRTR